MKKPYIVAVAGGTCGGKSTLTESLGNIFSAACDTKVLNMDSYFKENPPTTVAPITRKTYVEHNHPDTLDLDRLKADLEAACNSECDLILIEGLFALYFDWIREKADLKIFVDLASDARLVRRIKKHMGWGETYEQVTDRYIDTVRFRHDELIEPTRWHADIVVNGTLSDNLGTAVAETYIRAQLAAR